MIDEPFAKNQVRRLQSLKFFPQDPVAIRELVNALRCAATEAIATEAVDEFVRTLTDCPVPADVRRSVFAKEPEEPEYALPYEAPAPGTLCPICRSNGTIQDGATRKRCTCPAGEEFPQNLLDMMNAPTKAKGSQPARPPGPQSMKPITQSDIDAALAERGRK